MERLEKIQELSELYNRYVHGFNTHESKRGNIFEVLYIIGQIDDYKYIDIKDLKKIEILIKSLKRVLLFNK
jgi:hypothetical protein